MNSPRVSMGWVFIEALVLSSFLPKDPLTYNPAFFLVRTILVMVPLYFTCLHCLQHFFFDFLNTSSIYIHKLSVSFTFTSVTRIALQAVYMLAPNRDKIYSIHHLGYWWPLNKWLSCIFFQFQSLRNVYPRYLLASQYRDTYLYLVFFVEFLFN